MKVITLIFAICLSSGLWSQSLKQATNLFEKYEYARACAIFSEFNNLSVEDYKKMAYGYYTIGDYKKCLPISDSIIKMTSVEPFFFYVNGEVNFAQRNYTEAKASYIKYQSLDDEYNVANKILSCDLTSTEEVSATLSNDMLPGNNSKANLTGEQYLDGVIEFIEVGQDSSGAFVDRAAVDDAELVLARPFVRIGSEEGQMIVLDEAFRDASITSFTLKEVTSEVWLTVARPLEIEQIDKVPHLYHGKFDATTLTVTDLQLWSYSGYEDSAACAHATINESGNLIVFSKSNHKTNGSDLYQSTFNGTEWGTPTALEIFNTPQEEMYPQFMGDSMLSFSSDGRPGFGGLDIYTSKIENGSFGTVEHIAAPVNGFMDDFNFNYYSDSTARYTSNRPGGLGDDDMYYIHYEIDRPIPVPVPEPCDSCDFNDFVNSFKAPIFYFEFDKFDLEDNPKKVKELVNFLAEYPNSSIIVEGHTDRRGSDEYNMNLSKERASTLRLALIKKGIRETQITIEGKGNTDPQDKCDICTKEMHAKNRFARVLLVAK
ncbi:MAG: hypothetical protein COA38_17755 [Fluviicola sp.]|nr:MAG: hypothetical protein COA38_17755 [Fluviicola sp.]